MVPRRIPAGSGRCMRFGSTGLGSMRHDHRSPGPVCGFEPIFDCFSSQTRLQGSYPRGNGDKSVEGSKVISPLMDTGCFNIDAGDAGMAFADSLLTDTDTHIVVLDRRHRPDRHWQDACPFCKAASAFSFLRCEFARVEPRHQTNRSRAGTRVSTVWLAAPSYYVRAAVLCGRTLSN